MTPVLAGAAIEFLFPFNPNTVWNRLAAPYLPETAEKREKITFLTAVPTIWNRLLSTFPSLPAETQHAAKEAISPQNLRLNISGSAALPTPTKNAWTELSNGNVLLERYGMTEVGMAISCGLDFADRVDGSVGWPLPSVEVRLWDAEKNEIIRMGEEVDPASGRERVGEIQLRGPTIFREYFKNESATADAFVASDDGKGAWFRTGDVAVRKAAPGRSGQGTSGEWATGPMYFIQGRLSVDIIKTGGEKVSALEIERELLSLFVPIATPCVWWIDLIDVHSQTRNHRSGRRRPPVGAMGTESGRGARSGSYDGPAWWSRRQALGDDGYAPGVEGPPSPLQDPATVDDPE